MYFTYLHMASIINVVHQLSPFQLVCLQRSNHIFHLQSISTVELSLKGFQGMMFSSFPPFSGGDFTV